MLAEMNPIHRLESRAAISIAAALFSFGAISIRRLYSLTNRTFDAIACWTLPISRIAAFLTIFFVAKVSPHGDVIRYYFPQAQAILDGKLPYRDFYSSYAPLYGYVYAGVLCLWHSPLAIILFAIVAEFCLLPLWFTVARLYFGETELRTAALLYICSPVSIFLVAIDGQNSILVGVLLALAVVMLVLHRPLASGAVFALNIIAVKFLPLLYLPSFLIATGRRLRWLSGFLVVATLGYAAFVLRHAPIFAPLYVEGRSRTSGGLPYLIGMLTEGVLPGQLWDLITLAMLLSILILAIIKSKEASRQAAFKILILSMPALTCALLLFSKKSVPNYVLFSLFPMCLVISSATKKTIALFLAFMTCATIEPGYWFALMDLAPASTIQRSLLGIDPTVTIFFVLECIVVAGYAWLAVRSVLLLISAVSGNKESAVARSRMLQPSLISKYPKPMQG
jgi:hypothetical protein